ncbi:MAG: hypothetical protein ACRC0X_02965, partial [Brevinema sp.]
MYTKNSYILYGKTEQRTHQQNLSDTAWNKLVDLATKEYNKNPEKYIKVHITSSFRTYISQTKILMDKLEHTTNMFQYYKNQIKESENHKTGTKRKVGTSDTLNYLDALQSAFDLKPYDPIRWQKIKKHQEQIANIRKIHDHSNRKRAVEHLLLEFMKP